MNNFDFYDEVEKAHDQADLNRVRSPFFNIASWNANIVDRFVMALTKSITKKYPQAKITKEIFQKEDLTRDYMVKINIQLNEFSKNVDLNVDMIRSPKCPKDLPFVIASQFIELIDKHIIRQKRRK